MSRQPSLPGFDSPFHDEERPHGPDNVFFALIPDVPAVEATLALREHLKKSQRLDGAMRPATLLHVTVCSLPDYSPSLGVKDLYAEAALAAVASLNYRETSVMFDHVERYGGGAYALAGNNDEVVGLAKTLGVLLGHAGIRREHGSPHMTMFYPRGNPQRLKVQPVSWVAKEVVLIRSHVGQSRHERLGSVPLSPNPNCVYR